MTKRTISFVNPNFQQGPKEFNAYFLPYSAGVILSYALSFEHIKTAWEIDQLIWRREPIEDLAPRLAKNDVVAFSTYVWSHRYNYKLAEKIKQLNPKVTIIFGGPEIAIEDINLFEKEPFMDLVVKLEGEITFKRILEDFDTDFSHIPGLLINTPTGLVNTGDCARIDDLDQIPSPYLAGIFDRIIEENPNITWNATLETNRGCPYQCTFCDWGSLTYSKVKKFKLTRVFHELEWIGANCGFVYITDANFGMFVERDNAISDKLIEVQKKYGKLSSFSMTWAKNQKNEVVDIVKKLIKESPNFGQGLTVSVQSMDHDVLENIKRRNLDQHKIDEIFNLCDRNNIPVYTEVILGLPGETVESWKECFWKIFRAGNHIGINIFQAQLLENAEMNLLQKRMWKIESVPVYDYILGSYEETDYNSECLDVVISTKDIPREQMLDTMVWNCFIQTFHINGLTTYIARYFAKAHNIDYGDFYDALFIWMRKDQWFNQQFMETRSFYEKWMTQGRINHPPIGNIRIYGWNLLYRIFMLMIQENKIDYMFDSINKFLKNNYNLNTDLLEQLLHFQRNYFIDYKDLQVLPKVKTYDYDFLGYILDSTDLNKSTTYQFDSTEDKSMSMDRFLENMHYGRKRNFGKTTITRDQAYNIELAQI
jgi:tRNA A37 methylthiotransferase MiaB